MSLFACDTDLIQKTTVNKILLLNLHHTLYFILPFFFCFYLYHFQPYLFILLIFLLLSLYLTLIIFSFLYCFLQYPYPSYITISLLTLSFLRILSELATVFIQNNLQQDENPNYVAELEDLLHRFPLLVFQVWIKSNICKRVNKFRKIRRHIYFHHRRLKMQQIVFFLLFNKLTI